MTGKSIGYIICTVNIWVVREGFVNSFTIFQTKIFSWYGIFCIYSEFMLSNFALHIILPQQKKFPNEIQDKKEKRSNADILKVRHTKACIISFWKHDYCHIFCQNEWSGIYFNSFFCD